MVHMRPDVPQGHGELLERPEFSRWDLLMRESHARLSVDQMPLGGTTLARLRHLARREAIAEAMAFSGRLGVEFDQTIVDPTLVALTGHQPELFHPGVWIKHFLLDRLCDESGAVGIDLVVDTDTFESVELHAPCLHPRVDRCSQALVTSDGTATFLGTAVPDAEAIEEFCSGGEKMLAGLPAPAIGRHFADFCSCLSSAAPDAANLGELLTIARRRYEAPARTGYLELPVSRMVTTQAYLRFAAHLLLDAAAFAREYNEELSLYRVGSKTRSRNQPFPDLGTEGERIEAPFWFVDQKGREPVWVLRAEGRIDVFAGSELIAHCSDEVTVLADALRGTAVLAPRAVTLTLYARLVLGDLFIHGVGGGRYDAVTDGVIRRYFGVEPPPFAVASMTMYLPLGAHIVTESEVAEARQGLHRLAHNPDAMLDVAEFDDATERVRATELAAEKAGLVDQIKADGADKKAIGTRIREINAELARLLAPVATALQEEVELLEGQLAASTVLTDREYPFCLWNPIEVQDKARSSL